MGFGVKLEHVQTYLAGTPADDLVMFTDAFDVLLMASQAEIRAAFGRAVRLGMAREADPSGAGRVPTIVFSTEYYCWPDSGRAAEYPESDRAFQSAYLNSGEWEWPGLPVGVLELG